MTASKIRQYMLRCLAKRDYSQKEMRRKLEMKGCPEALLLSLMAECLELNLINDVRYTEAFIRSKMHKGYGPLYLTYALKQKGIAEEVIAEQVEMTDNRWFIQMQHVWQKHFKGEKPKDLKIRAKQMRFLQNRGFSLEQIQRFFEKMADDFK